MERKSAPTVALYWEVYFPVMYLCIREVFPTLGIGKDVILNYWEVCGNGNGVGTGVVLTRSLQ